MKSTVVLQLQLQLSIYYEDQNENPLIFFK